MARTHGIEQRRGLSQVFLTASWPVERMTKLMAEQNIKNILEVGPGGGALTKVLSSAGMHVTAVEKDARFAAMLESQNLPNVVSLTGDALEFNLIDWATRCDGPRAMAGNIPYKISSPLTEWMLPALRPVTQGHAQTAPIQFAMMMVQKEFGVRIAAAPGSKDYSSLTVFVALRARAKLEFVVPRGAFKPVPKVDSVVVSFSPLSQNLDLSLLEKCEVITRAAFQKRRKMLRSSLAYCLNDLNADRCPVELTRRPETLSPDEFVQLTRFIHRIDI